MRDIEALIKDIIDGNFDSKFIEMYSTDDGASIAKKRYIKLMEGFKKSFSNSLVEVYSAPGRSEICGNHTDHQQGKVLACSIDLDAVAVVSKREDNIVEIISEGFDIKPVSLDNLEIESSMLETTESLIKGVSAGLAKEGYKIGGFSAYMNSTVLGGSGLSSSAAFEVLIGTIMSGLYNDMKVEPIKIAQIGQYAENYYFGKPCGLMDQMASSVGGFVYIDFSDKNVPEVSKVDFNFKNAAHNLCIVDTGGSHEDLTQDYADVPFELKQIVGFFGKNVLRECEEEEFFYNIKELRKVAGDRAVLRAIHIFEENKRVENAVNALKNDDFESFKKLIVKSGQSSFMYLQNVYTTKNLREQGLSLGLAISQKILDGKGAWRVHGGGFAGTIQAFVPNDLLEEYKNQIEFVFGKGSCYCLNVRQMGGTKVV